MVHVHRCFDKIQKGWGAAQRGYHPLVTIPPENRNATQKRKKIRVGPAQWQLERSGRKTRSFFGKFRSVRGKRIHGLRQPQNNLVPRHIRVEAWTSPNGFILSRLKPLCDVWRLTRRLRRAKGRSLRAFRSREGSGKWPRGWRCRGLSGSPPAAPRRRPPAPTRRRARG